MHTSELEALDSCAVIASSCAPGLLLDTTLTGCRLGACFLSPVRGVCLSSSLKPLL